MEGGSRGLRRAYTVKQLLESYRAGDTDPVEHVSRVLDALRRWERDVNAFISLEAEEVLIDAAEEAARRWRRGEARRLEGVVVGVKDNISTSFLPTTAGSRMLDGYIPPFNATVVERLLMEGAIIIGKTNLDEFAMGSTGEFSAFGPTRNPWDLSRVPGGSSSGSGACLAYGACDAALGSDTGGSVRLPAAYTATVGLKPTYGLVSRYGLIPYANSLEQISPMARSSEDVMLLLEVIAGGDEYDATSIYSKPTTASREEGLKPEDLSLCIPEELVEHSEEAVRKAFYNTVGKLEGLGARLEYVGLGGAEAYALPAYYTIALAEAASNLARYDGSLYPVRGSSGDYWRQAAEARGIGFGLEVKRRILMGVYVLSEGYKDEYYLAATKLRRVIRDAMLKTVGKCLVATPASPIMPPRIGERVDDPLKLYAMDVYTVLANLSGLPAIALPIEIHGGLPVGLQLIGPRLGERLLAGAANIIEDLTGLAGVVAG
ncbi:amidase family protein [Aeropyrum pernix]|uniref:amidase family protein n=1 Tax=Aeropyrum pernix TaxID=56636 RepID=UPI000005E06A|nr:amidase family protein [Aeropyrum pernix]